MLLFGLAWRNIRLPDEQISQRNARASHFIRMAKSIEHFLYSHVFIVHYNVKRTISIGIRYITEWSKVLIKFVHDHQTWNNNNGQNWYNRTHIYCIYLFKNWEQSKMFMISKLIILNFAARNKKKTKEKLALFERDTLFFGEWPSSYRAIRIYTINSWKTNRKHHGSTKYKRICIFNQRSANR